MTAAPIGAHPLDAFCQQLRPYDAEELNLRVLRNCNDCSPEIMDLACNGTAACGANPACDASPASTALPLFPKHKLCFNKMLRLEMRYYRYCEQDGSTVTALSQAQLDTALASAEGSTARADGLQLLLQNHRELQEAARLNAMQAQIAAAGVNYATAAAKEVLPKIEQYAVGTSMPLAKRYQRFERKLTEGYRNTYAQLRQRALARQQKYSAQADQVAGIIRRLGGGDALAAADVAEGTKVVDSDHPAADRFNATIDEGGGDDIATGGPNDDTLGVDADPLAGAAERRDLGGLDAPATDPDDKELTGDSAVAMSIVERSRNLTGAQRVAFERAVAELGGDEAAALAIAENVREVTPRLDAAFAELRKDVRQFNLSYNYEDDAIVANQMVTPQAELRATIARRAEELGIPDMLKQLYMVDENGQMNAAAAVLVTDEVYGDGNRLPAYAGDPNSFAEIYIQEHDTYRKLELDAALDTDFLTNESLAGNITDGFTEVRQNFADRFSDLDTMETRIRTAAAAENESGLMSIFNTVTNPLGALTKDTPESLLRELTFEHPDAAAMVAMDDPAAKARITTVLTDAIAIDEFKDEALFAGEVGLGVGSLFVGGPIGKGLTKGGAWVAGKTGLTNLGRSGLAALGVTATRADRFFGMSGAMLTRASVGMGVGADAAAVASYADALNDINDAQLQVMANPDVKGIALLGQVTEKANNQQLWAAVSGVAATTSVGAGGYSLLNRTVLAGGTPRTLAFTPGATGRVTLSAADDIDPWAVGPSMSEVPLVSRTRPINVDEHLYRGDLSTVDPHSLSDGEIRNILGIQADATIPADQMALARRQVVDAIIARQQAEAAARAAGWTPNAADTTFRASTDFVRNDLFSGTPNDVNLPHPMMYTDNPAFGSLPGWYNVTIHGKPGVLTVGDDMYTPAELANSIRRSGHNDGQPIMLFSCWGGQACEWSGTSNAQALANELGVPVVSADNAIDADRYILFREGSFGYEFEGTWHLFRPGE